MKQFADFDQLTKAFINKDFSADAKVQVGDDVFTLAAQNKVTVTEALSGKKPIAVYTAEDSTTRPDRQLVLFWKNEGPTVVPGGVLLATKDEVTIPSQELVVEMNGEKVTIRPDQLIGDIATVKFTSFSSPRELKGKVDTGATISSLHADNYKINGNTVTFTCQPLGPNSVTVPLKTQHAVKSPDGGTHYRPVVELNVKVNGKLLNNVLFNLNDRGNMDQPVLLGVNILQAGKFFVDPTRNEGTEMDWSELEKLVEAVELPEADDSAIQEIYQKMLDSDISFRDLVRHIRGEVIKTDLEG